MRQTFKKLSFILITFFAALSIASGSENKIQIVTSFSILADMANNIAGDKAEINTIVGRNSDAHAFEPTPKNVKQLAGADLLIVNGLNFEPWLERLKQAAGFQAKELIASKDISALHLGNPGASKLDDHDHVDEHDHHDHNHGDIDPHAWQSPKNAEIYINNIAQALIDIDPDNSEYYLTNANSYIAEIILLADQINEQLANIPKNRRVILTSHDSFGYFARDYDIKFISVTGLSSTAEPSAKRIANLTNIIKDQHVVAIFLENMTNNSVLKQIAKETGSNIGGTLYSDALASDDSPASTYLGMLRWNADQIVHALQENN